MKLVRSKTSLHREWGVLVNESALWELMHTVYGEVLRRIKDAAFILGLSQCSLLRTVLGKAFFDFGLCKTAIVS